MARMEKIEELHGKRTALSMEQSLIVFGCERKKLNVAVD